jgi:hypothetical protein
MNFFDDVTPKSVKSAADGFLEFKTGDNEASVKMAYEGTSQSGNPMLTIIFTTAEGAEIKYYISNNEYKLQRLKQFYLAFNIPMGNNQIEEWRGKKGIVVCKMEPYNGKTYPKVSYLKPLIAQDITDKRNDNHNSPKPPSNAANDPFIDDIPF